jgi:hypothetical protein
MKDEIVLRVIEICGDAGSGRFEALAGPAKKV